MPQHKTCRPFAKKICETTACEALKLCTFGFFHAIELIRATPPTLMLAKKPLASRRFGRVLDADGSALTLQPFALQETHGTSLQSTLNYVTGSWSLSDAAGNGVL
mmetsp:Transcript_26691/g.50147  ORF Transcript_26691/g.50147 Transcript_26691/m.50147 type:complete len:105 (-) Transcript_26691:16-330(-)